MVSLYQRQGPPQKGELMELLIAERIKKFRKERDMTQDALASALGISPQSISKWECGDGYPDITLLPSIANFFGITVDELIGNDEISAKEDIQKNYFFRLHDRPVDERLELSLKYHKKYPRDWHIATSLMHQITRYNRDKIDEYKPMLTEICERILKECSDTTSRQNAVKSMCMICDEEDIGKWLRKDSIFWRDEKLEIYEERYKLSGDKEKYWMYRHAVNVVKAASVINQFYGPSPYSNAEEAIAWYNNCIHILDSFTLRKTDSDIPDGFICEYRREYIHLAAAYFKCGDKENGYDYLERALALTERFAVIPRGTPLDLGNELFFGKTKLIEGKWRIELPNGKSYIHLLGLVCKMGNIDKKMTAEKGWEWFDSVRGEARWNEILERARALNNTDNN